MSSNNTNICATARAVREAALVMHSAYITISDGVYEAGRPSDSVVEHCLMPA